MELEAYYRDVERAAADLDVYWRESEQQPSYGHAAALVTAA